MDITQIVLLSVVIVLAIFLVVLGVQVFYVLKDLRKTLKKFNLLLDGTDDLVNQVKKPIESASNVFSALTAGVGIAHLLKKGEKHERQK